MNPVPPSCRQVARPCSKGPRERMTRNLTALASIHDEDHFSSFLIEQWTYLLQRQGANIARCRNLWLVPQVLFFARVFFSLFFGWCARREAPLSSPARARTSTFSALTSFRLSSKKNHQHSHDQPSRNSLDGVVSCRPHLCTCTSQIPYDGEIDQWKNAFCSTVVVVTMFRLTHACRHICFEFADCVILPTPARSDTCRSLRLRQQEIARRF